MNFVLDGSIFLFGMLCITIFYRQEFSLITKKSLVLGLLMGMVSTAGFIFMLYAWQLAPVKLPKIMVIIGFSTVITAMISNFTGAKLSISEWFWAIGAAICIAGLNWKN